MNCESFAAATVDLARGQMMEAKLREQALEHCHHCVECAARLKEEQQLTENLRALSGQMHAITAPPDLEGRLLDEFRSHSVQPRQRRLGRWLYGAVAASLLLGVGLVAAQFYGDPGPQISTTNAPPTQTVEAIASNAPLSTPVVETLPDTPAPKPRQRVSRPRKQTAQVNALATSSLSAANREPEVTTDFLLVGDANSLSTLDGGQMVRVELPRSAMARFGLPINVERYNERVKADVIMGTDGLARAIRFVQ